MLAELGAGGGGGGGAFVTRDEATIKAASLQRDKEKGSWGWGGLGALEGGTRERVGERHKWRIK